MNTVLYGTESHTLIVVSGDVVKITEESGKVGNYIVTVATVNGCGWEAKATYNLSSLETGKRWTRAMTLADLSKYVQFGCENDRMEYIGAVEMVLKPKGDR